MKSKYAGFTLIELMVAAAIIGVLASIAWPAYQEYVARSRITEGLYLPAGLQAEVAQQVDDVTSLADLAASWNAGAGGAGATSKYVQSVQIADDTGEITVTFNANNVGSIPAGSTIVLTPYRMLNGVFVPLATAIDAANAPNRNMTTWGCASSTNSTATAKGYPALTPGTLDPKFVPSECR